MRRILLLSLCLSLSGSLSAQESYTLKNVSYKPGQKLFVGLQGHEIGSPIRVEVKDQNGQPAVGLKVCFEVVEKPSKAKGESLSHPEAVTDTLGVAETRFIVGDAAGDYVVIARTDRMAGPTPSILVRAQKTLWWMFLAIGLFGGLGIFLYGMGLGSNGLQKIAGERLRTILAALTSNRFMGVVVGIVVTAIVQSSSATSVMVVGLVSSALMTLRQAIGVLMGAHIGTAITVQLIAFNISDYSLLLVGAGFLMTLVTKRKFYIYLGEIILGFGFIFFGMAVMSQAIHPLKSMPAFAQWLIEFGQNPILGILASAAFTAIIQSSGATIGLCVVMASEGLLSLQSAMPLVFGANVGTCATALLSSIGAPTGGKRSALAHTMFSVIGVVLFTPFLVPFEQLIMTVTSWMGTESVPRQIANGHMMFNILSAGVLISFVPVFEKFITRMIPEKAEAEEFRPKYLNNTYLETPEIALQQAHLEEGRLIAITRQMYEESRSVFRHNNEAALNALKDHLKNVNLLEYETRRYLTRLSQKNISLFQSRRLMRILVTIDDLRHIAQTVGETIVQLAEKYADNKWSFSADGKKELERFFATVEERLQKTLTALEKEDPAAASELIRTKHASSELEIQLRESHIQRLQKGVQETVVTSTVHLDLLTALKRIDTLCVKIAHGVNEQFKM